jgi:FO synthase
MNSRAKSDDLSGADTSHESPVTSHAISAWLKASAAELMPEAAALRDAGHGRMVSYSRKVFIPLTRLCRDVCSYCTFANLPRPGARAYLTPEEVLAIARVGRDARCYEALFTLGDKPELRYKVARQELTSLGYASTVQYLAAMCALVRSETGLLAHVNPGVLTREEITLLRRVSASQGLMLESTAERLCERGGPHFGSPDKRPAVRIETLRHAGELAVPFTTGILIGIGETRHERIDALLAIRRLHEEHGHVQEVIVQNFRAKTGTRMADAPHAAHEELLWSIAVGRLILGPSMNIQAPPNLSEPGYGALIDAGINDWGGVSPVTPDHVNPEAPWPAVADLERVTAAHGKILVERLPSYPRYCRAASQWHDSAIATAVVRAADADGYARVDRWSPGLRGWNGGDGPLPAHHRVLPVPPVPPVATSHSVASEDSENGTLPARHRVLPVPPVPPVASSHNLASEDSESGPLPARHRSFLRAQPLSPELYDIIAQASAGTALAEQQLVRLFGARGDEFDLVCEAADQLRQAASGDTVRYVVNRNINYTNICSYHCTFCAFSKGSPAHSERGVPYDLKLEEIGRRVSESWQRGATEVCMQGGIHPDYTGETYLAIVRAAKRAVPQIHVHAFTPLEVSHGAATLKVTVREFLAELMAAGLGSLPGTAAEILDDEIRRRICPDKVTTAEWLSVMETAHELGLRSTVTIMFGHIDEPRHWARHLMRIRTLQERTGGFTEFVPLPFVHMHSPVYLKGEARKGPTSREAVLMHAVARLALHPVISNIQVSWVKLGLAGARACLAAGANDCGGTLMNESISRAAGADHGQEMPPAALEALIRSLGRSPAQRTTLYGTSPAAQIDRSYAAPALAPLEQRTPSRTA